MFLFRIVINYVWRSQCLQGLCCIVIFNSIFLLDKINKGCTFVLT